MKSIFFFLFSIIFLLNQGKAQILIGGKKTTKIYSSIRNVIQYTGKLDCNNLRVKIDGFEEVFFSDDCSFTLGYLKNDSSSMKIINTEEEVIFQTTLFREKLQAKAYLKVGNNFISEGTISKKDLSQVQKLSVFYNCPWVDPALTRSFTLTIVEKNGQYKVFEIKGANITDKIKYEISLINDPQRMYIDKIDWRPLSCFESMNSIVLDIK